jgi:hypothetical protein
MTMLKLAPLFAAALLASACDVHIGNDANGTQSVDLNAPGNGQDGRVTIRTPGFNMSVDVPESVRAEMHADSTDGFLYPGATVGGVHVDANEGNGTVDIAFSSPDSSALVANWYRDPARGSDVHIASAARNGAAYVIAGTRRDDQHFEVRLTPRNGGGVDGRLVLTGTDN